jgi:hypothetical protein
VRYLVLLFYTQRDLSQARRKRSVLVLCSSNQLCDPLLLQLVQLSSATWLTQGKRIILRRIGKGEALGKLERAGRANAIVNCKVGGKFW